MQYLAKAVQYYKDINPATLSGAIDVIVVERTDETGVTLAASPFHVRFGKLSVLRPIDKKVRITVNDEPIPFFMKVGETGEAFFVFETDAELPEDMQTSPLTGPLSDEEVEAPGEPEFLDLGASQTESTMDTSSTLEIDPRRNSSSSIESTASHSRYASMDQSRLASPSTTFHPLPPSFTSSTLESTTLSSFSPSVLVPAAASVVIGAASNLGRAAITGLSGNRKLAELSAGRESRLESDGENGVVNGSTEQELGELERKMREDLGGLSLDDESLRNSSNHTGDEVRIAARERDEDLRKLSSRRDDQVNDEADLILSRSTGLQHEKLESIHAPEMAGDIMLDMAGYKIEDEILPNGDSSAHTTQNEDALNPELDSALDNRAEKELIAFTQGLLQSADPKTLSGFFGPVEPATLDLSAEPAPPVSPSVAEFDLTTLRSHSSTSLPALGRLDSLDANDSVEKSIGAGVFQASPKEFSLKIGGKLHVFELSLGGGGEFGQNPIYDEQAFLAQQVTSSQFMTQDTLTGHANLVVKYAGRYLTWDNASPVLASLAVYRKSLVDHPEYHNLSRLDTDAGLSSAEIDTKRSSRGWGLWWSKKESVEPILPIAGPDSSPPTSPPISEPASPRSFPLPTSPELESPLDGIPTDPKKHYAKTLRLTSDQLKQLGLKKGMNIISFSVRSSYSGYATCTSRIFLWESDFQVVISDIDGTITKSDALGHVFTMIGRDWTHLGVAKLYTDIARNGYKMMYLTSRAIGQADTTREYLRGIKQNGYQLPEGPVIMSPDRLMTSLHREVVLRKPEVFKMACLRDIQRLFSDRTPFTPFYSGFGNRITDALSYRSVDIPSSKIFTIDTNGEVKMELLELAGYKSSYIHMTDLVDQMFPPINRKTTPDFTDFNFWRQPVAQFDLPDFPPPSPALSARSDTSSRLGLKRLGSLATSLSRRSSKPTLGRTGTPTSPLLQATLVEEPNGMSDEDYDDRSESSSMPGSLPNEENFEARYRNSKNVGEEAEDSESEEEGEEENEEEDGEVDEFGEELDFSSVPY